MTFCHMCFWELCQYPLYITPYRTVNISKKHLKMSETEPRVLSLKINKMTKPIKLYKPFFMHA